MNELAARLDLEPAAFVVCLCAVMAAGLVRGFAGFALSAVVMAAIATIIPPVELIPICWFMELMASFLLLRGGVGEADRKVVFGLVIGSVIGSPIGLYATNAVDADTSRTIALGLVAVLAALQLLKVRARALATTGGLYASGLAAGVVTGLANIGGMVVALYVLARDAPPRVMRASLILYLFVTSPVAFLYLLAYDMIDGPAIARALVFGVVSSLGVIIGRRFFNPTLEPFYKRFCLTLLIALAVWGLVRLAL